MVLAVPVPLQLPEDVLGCGGTVRLAGLLPPRRHKHRDLLQGLTEVSGSVVDPNTLKLDPDPEFLPNLDPDPGLCYQF